MDSAVWQIGGPMTLDELYLAQNKDVSFREEFYAELLEYGKTLLRKWYHGRWQQYEDALQDLLINLIDPSKAKPNGTASFHTWFYRALTQRCRSFEGMESREHSIERMPEEVQALYRPKSFNEVINTIDLTQRLKILSKLQREIIALTIQGYTQQEISEKLHVTQKNVSNQYGSAVKKLRA